MKFWMHKYKRRISSLILTCYLIVITLGISHYHTYDLNRPKVFTTENTASGFYKTDITSGFDCVVQQNISQLHNFSFEFNASLNCFIQNVEKFSPSESIRLIPFTFSFPNQLRAPPSYS